MVGRVVLFLFLVQRMGFKCVVRVGRDRSGNSHASRHAFTQVFIILAMEEANEDDLIKSHR